MDDLTGTGMWAVHSYVTENVVFGYLWIMQLRLPLFFLLPARRLKDKKKAVGKMSGWAPFSRLVFGNLGSG